MKNSWGGEIQLRARKHEPTMYFSAKNANVTLGCIARNRCPGSRKVIVPLCCALLGYVWNLQIKRDIGTMECIQETMTQMVKSLVISQTRNASGKVGDV